MLNRKEMVAKYMETKIDAGIYRVRETSSNYCYYHHSFNLGKAWNSIRFQLELGGFRDKELQTLYNENGPDSVVYEIIEIWKPSFEGQTCTYEDLQRMLKKHDGSNAIS